MSAQCETASASFRPYSRRLACSTITDMRQRQHILLSHLKTLYIVPAVKIKLKPTAPQSVTHPANGANKCIAEGLD